MKRKISLTAAIWAILACTLIASATVAQTEQTDPLTGKPLAAPAEPEGPPRADLTEATMIGANTKGANLSRANLSDANITQEQLSIIGSLKLAIMPDGTERE